MIDYSRELRAQLAEVERFLMIAKKDLKTREGLPEGSLRVTDSKGIPQFYFKAKGAKKSIYVPAKDKEIIPKLIQVEYEKKVLQALEEECRNLEHFLNHYNPKCLDEIYARLCKVRRNLIIPIALTDEEFLKKWYEEHPGDQNPFEKQVTYETERGEMVRSKSEKILADTFYKMGVPYSYEPKLVLLDHKSIYPDFACLNLRTRKIIYWEHLGLLDDGEYAIKNYAKIEMYERAGYLLGDTLLVSMESPQKPLDVALIRKKIEMFLK